MKHESLKAYLFSSGILEHGSSEEIAAAKKEYRRQYLRRKQQEYRAKHKTVSLSFDQAYIQELEAKAMKYQMKVPAFIKACVQAYLERLYILPNETEVQRLELLLQRIGDNVNQIARLCNRLSIPPTEAITEVHGFLEKLDKQLHAFLREPRHFEEVIQEGIKGSPLFLSHLQSIINQYAHAPQDHTASKQ